MVEDIYLTFAEIFFFPRSLALYRITRKPKNSSKAKIRTPPSPNKPHYYTKCRNCRVFLVLVLSFLYFSTDSLPQSPLKPMEKTQWLQGKLDQGLGAYTVKFRPQSCNFLHVGSCVHTEPLRLQQGLMQVSSLLSLKKWSDQSLNLALTLCTRD